MIYLRTEKTGGAVGSPRMVGCCRFRLERNPEAELQLPHQAVGLQAGNQTAVMSNRPSYLIDAVAVNATVGIAVYGMVEHVEELRLELCVNPLGDGEVLEDGHVIQEFSRSGE